MKQDLLVNFFFSIIFFNSFFFFLFFHEGTIKAEKTSSLSVDSLSEFVNTNVEKTFEEASITLKEKFQTEFKDLISELEDYKEKCRKMMSSESHKQMNVGHPNKEGSSPTLQKTDVSINASKIEIIDKVIFYF